MVSGCPVRATGEFLRSHVLLIETRGVDGLRLLFPTLPSPQKTAIINYLKKEEPQLYAKLEPYLNGGYANK